MSTNIALGFLVFWFIVFLGIMSTIKDEFAENPFLFNGLLLLVSAIMAAAVVSVWRKKL